MDMLVVDVVNVQDDGEQLIWQEKPTSSLMTHGTLSSDKPPKTIGPRLEVSSVLCLCLNCK